jgi:hypothetical protein
MGTWVHAGAPMDLRTRRPIALPAILVPVFLPWQADDGGLVGLFCKRTP